MIGQANSVNPEKVHDLRVEMGKWLRQLREAQGLSQRDLAKRLNLDYYTFISQLENGRGRIPPSRYSEWADALNVRAGDFVRKVLYYTEPSTYDILFGNAD